VSDNSLAHQLNRDKARREGQQARKDARGDRTEWEESSAAEPLCCTGCETIYDAGFDMLTCPKCDGDLVSLSFAKTASETPEGFLIDGYTVAMTIMGLVVLGVLGLSML